MDEVRIYSARRLGLYLSIAGAAGLGLGLARDALRRPLLLILAAGLLVAGLLVALDRRPQLMLSDAGIRCARWGSTRLPWLEFSGYRWVSWRHQRLLELLPRRPEELIGALSAYGRLNAHCARLLRMPAFAIAPAPLEIDEARLERLVARHLPAQPAG